MVELLRDFKSGKRTCVAVMEEVLQRQKDSSQYNHYIEINEKKNLESAALADKRYASGTNRLLEGIPMAVKANVNCGDGSITNGGSTTLGDFRPKYASHLWFKLNTYGAINAGKTNLHEFSFGTTS